MLIPYNANAISNPTIQDGGATAIYNIMGQKLSQPVKGLNYNRWDVCRAAVEKGREIGLPVYKFLEEPLVRRFGREWYQELCDTAEMLTQETV